MIDAATRDKMKTYRLGELFCGPGGIGMGAEHSSLTLNGVRHEIKHTWATDIDPDACNTYRNNLCPDNPDSVICRNVQDLRFSTLADIDALTFGFPCNDFSIIGEQRGLGGKYGPLYTYGVKAIEHFKPKWFMAENVGGMRNANGGRAMETISTALAATKLGYNITAHYYRFEDYGVPQTRHRLILVGIRADLGKHYAVPRPTHPGCHKSSREAIEVPPIPGNSANHDRARQSPQVVERLALIKPGQNAWNADLPPHLQLQVKGARLSQIYRRLDPTRPAYTVTGSGGGGTHVYHWDEPRALTNRERARLQTFPDNFVFSGTPGRVRRQIGMAVPPRGVQAIMEAILKTLAGIPYDSIPPSLRNTSH